MMMHADGELQPAEVQELMAFINANPSLKNELAMYELTRLSPDESLVYDDKKSLLKPEPVKRTIAFPQWRKYSIAAGIALLVFASLFKYKEANKNVGEIVRIDTTKQVLPSPANSAQTPNNTTQKHDLQNIAVAPVHPVKIAPVMHHEKTTGTILNKKVVNTRQEDVAIVNKDAAIKTGSEINSLSVTGVKALPCNSAVATLPAVTVPPLALSSDNQPVKKSIWDNLPLDENKKNEIKDVATAVTNTYNKISNKKPGQENNGINIDIKHRKLSISF